MSTNGLSSSITIANSVSTESSSSFATKGSSSTIGKHEDFYKKLVQDLVNNQGYSQTQAEEFVEQFS